MTIHTRIRAALLALAALGLAGAAAADQLADIKAAGKITTATDMHYAPFDMLIDGTYQGMTKDLFDEVAKEIGVEPVYQDLPWTAQLPGLEVGKFDIVIAPVTITPERLERYTFTLPIADATVGLVKAVSNDAIKKPEDITGKTVGVQQGTAQFRQLAGLRREARRRRRQGIRHHRRGLRRPRRRPPRRRRRLLAEPRLPGQAARRRLRADRARDLRRAEVLRLGAAEGREQRQLRPGDRRRAR